MDVQGISRVSFNTTMAACTAGLASLFYACMRVKKWGPRTDDERLPAGLVAITCPCYLGEPDRRVLHRHCGWRDVITGPWTPSSTGIDDPIAVPVHLINGIWGTLSLGLFATGQYGLPDADRRGHEHGGHGLFTAAARHSSCHRRLAAAPSFSRRWPCRWC